MKVVNSAIFTFREEDEGTLEHLFWDCAKIKVFQRDFVEWVDTKLSHCRQLKVSKKPVILVTVLL